MKRIVSKQVTALYPGGQLLQDDYFKRVRENVFKTDPNTKKEDTGRPKKHVIDNSLGLGSNDRGHNAGAGMGLGRDENESDNRSLSSGYNDGSKADDEVGPGHKSITPDPYYGSDVYNELYLDLDMKGQGYDESIQGHQNVRGNLMKILNGTPVPMQHKRYDVDKLN